MSELVFVSGYGKTGTSSMVGMLNTSPDCCILYEAYLCRDGGMGSRGLQLVQAFPELEHAKTARSLSECYTLAAHEFWRLGYSYKFVGDKILSPSLSEKHFREAKTLPLIYMIRDLRTWLCKNIVVKDYNTEGGLATKAAAYVQAYINTFHCQRCLRVSLEAFLMDNINCMQKAFAFLGLTAPEESRRWWRSVGSYPSGSPKAAVNWWAGHDSSKLKPTKLDTTSRLRNHKFWDELLPIFDKYYCCPDKRWPRSHLDADLAAISTMASRYPNLAIEDLYEEVQSVSFGSGLLGALGHRSSNPHAKPFRIGRHN
jgi:hypothetical protein